MKKGAVSVTNIEAIELFKNIIVMMEQTEFPKREEIKEAYEIAIKALEAQTEVNIYDKEETYHGCTVQVLTNTVTGQTSVGWWKDNG